MKWAHRKVVGASVVDSKLFYKVVQRVKVFLVLSATALYLAIMSRYVGADDLPADTQFDGSVLK